MAGSPDEERSTTAPATDSQVILSLRDIGLRFGGVQALQGVDLDVRKGEIHSIIGPNGAGKSTLLNVINGFHRPQSGSLHFLGQKRTRMTPNRASRWGISRTFQNLALFHSMTVLDNIMSGSGKLMRASLIEQMLRLPRARREELEYRYKAEGIIEFLRIENIRRREVRHLPYGLQKRVDLARALATKPELLLLDEPMAGMNTEEKGDCCRFILDIRDELDVTIILVEHDMGVVMDISDWITVLDHGMRIASDEPSAVRADQKVINAYLGTEGEPEAPPAPPQTESAASPPMHS